MAVQTFYSSKSPVKNIHGDFLIIHGLVHYNERIINNMKVLTIRIMSKINSDKKYWFIKRGHAGLGFRSLVGYPNTWQGTIFWVACLVSMIVLPKLVDRLLETKGMGTIAFIFIGMAVWLPVTAIKTKYITEEDLKNHTS